MQELNEAEMFRSVLNEILIDLKQLHQATKENTRTLIALGEKIDGFDKRLENLQVMAPPPDLQPLKDQLTEFAKGLNDQVQSSMERMQSLFSHNLTNLTAVVETQPKPIVRRISLFPEYDNHGNFKFFIKFLVLLILGLCALGVISSRIQQAMDRSAWERPHESYRSFSEPPPGAAAAVQAPRHITKPVRRHRAVDSTAEASVE